MYKAVRLFNYKDGIGLEQDALRGVCEVEEHVCTTEDEIISACQDADAVMASSSRSPPASSIPCRSSSSSPARAWAITTSISRPRRSAASPSRT